MVKISCWHLKDIGGDQMGSNRVILSLGFFKFGYYQVEFF